MAVRGLYGEWTEALGNVFQVSNHMTLGDTEAAIVGGWRGAGAVIEHEENSRAVLLEKKRRWCITILACVRDSGNAHSITSKETMNLLSQFAWHGFGLFPGCGRSLPDELFILTRPHLQKRYPTIVGRGTGCVRRTCARTVETGHRP
jgi:protein arginine kinase